jgi:hypothetical protein
VLDQGSVVGICVDNLHYPVDPDLHLRQRFFSSMEECCMTYGSSSEHCMKSSEPNNNTKANVSLQDVDG